MYKYSCVIVRTYCDIIFIITCNHHVTGEILRDIINLNVKVSQKRILMSEMKENHVWNEVL